MVERLRSLFGKWLCTQRLVATSRDSGQRAENHEVVTVVGLWDRAILSAQVEAPGHAGAIARLRLQAFRHGGEKYLLHGEACQSGQRSPRRWLEFASVASALVPMIAVLTILSKLPALPRKQ